MYKEQFTAWKPKTKVLMLNSHDAGVIYKLSAGMPHFGRSEIEFIAKIHDSVAIANRAILKAIGKT